MTFATTCLHNWIIIHLPIAKINPLCLLFGSYFVIRFYKCTQKFLCRLNTNISVEKSDIFVHMMMKRIIKKATTTKIIFGSLLTIVAIYALLFCKYVI